MMERELLRIRGRLEAEMGYLPPLCAAHLNEARTRVAHILSIQRQPIGSFDWAPNITVLFREELLELARTRRACTGELHSVAEASVEP